MKMINRDVLLANTVCIAFGGQPLHVCQLGSSPLLILELIPKVSSADVFAKLSTLRAPDRLFDINKSFVRCCPFDRLLAGTCPSMEQSCASTYTQSGQFCTSPRSKFKGFEKTLKRIRFVQFAKVGLELPDI